MLAISEITRARRPSEVSNCEVLAGSSSADLRAWVSSAAHGACEAWTRLTSVRVADISLLQLFTVVRGDRSLPPGELPTDWILGGSGRRTGTVALIRGFAGDWAGSKREAAFFAGIVDSGHDCRFHPREREHRG